MSVRLEDVEIGKTYILSVGSDGEVVRCSWFGATNYTEVDSFSLHHAMVKVVGLNPLTLKEVIGEDQWIVNKSIAKKIDFYPEPIVNTTCPIVDSVCEDMQERAKMGMEKYGVNADRDDLSVEEWIAHAREEAMDFAVYLKKLEKELSKQKEATEHLVKRNQELNEANSALLAENVRLSQEGNQELSSLFEDRLEQAYWDFDAKRKKGNLDERSCFKITLRPLLRYGSAPLNSIKEVFEQPTEGQWVEIWEFENCIWGRTVAYHEGDLVQFDSIGDSWHDTDDFTKRFNPRYFIIAEESE